jgi:hypothetical protein
MSQFKLSNAFVDQYLSKPSPFGFNGLGEFVYLRTYSRLKLDDSGNETWSETVRRVVEGTYEIQRTHVANLILGWNSQQANTSAEEMFDRMWNMKFLPPGRGLWTMGTPMITDRHLGAALNNCAFVSTSGVGSPSRLSKPFEFLMDMSMLGVGVGFDTEGAKSGRIIKAPLGIINATHHVVGDTREGWVKSVALLIDSYGGTDEIMPKVLFDYSKIREAGVPLKTFGGVSSGSEPLKVLHQEIRETLEKNVGSTITITTIVDIMNMLGKCVVAGNVRRCIPKDSLVHTPDGLVPIQDVKIGDGVLTHDGTYQRVLKFFPQGEREIVRIHTTHGFFDCTSNHRMAVKTNDPGYDYAWIEAGKLQRGNKLITPTFGIMGGKKTKMPNLENWHGCPKLTADMAWFIGLFHASGGLLESAEANDWGIFLRVELTDDESRIHEAVLQQISSVLAPLIGISRTSSSFNKDQNLMYYNFCNIKLYSYFKHALNLGTENKRIPAWILQSTVDIREAYSKGVIDGFYKTGLDKSELEASCIMFARCEYVRQFQTLMYSIGKTTTLKSYNSTKYAFLYYDKEGEPIGMTAVISVSEETEKLVAVYDIEVEQNSNFVCEGYLVHNSAEISFGDHDSEEFLNLKNYTVNPQRMSYGWASNNSIFAPLGMDYTEVSKRIQDNGEPGLCWLENMKAYSRMVDAPDHKDYRVAGGNPCLEQSL